MPMISAFILGIVALLLTLCAIGLACIGERKAALKTVPYILLYAGIVFLAFVLK